MLLCDNLESVHDTFGRVVKLVDTPALGAGAARLGGSSPLSPTKIMNPDRDIRVIYFIRRERTRKTEAQGSNET